MRGPAHGKIPLTPVSEDREAEWSTAAPGSSLV